MSNIKDRLNEPVPPRPGASGEFKHMRQNGQASAEEIRAFLRSIKGRSPQEVLGVVAQSGLASGILLATIGCLVLLVVFSVIPYQLNKLAAEEDSPKTQAATQSEASENESAPAEQPAAVPAESPASATGTGQPPENLPGALGIGETKAADPDKNPLDSGPDIDNLLDGVD